MSSATAMQAVIAGRAGPAPPATSHTATAADRLAASAAWAAPLDRVVCAVDDSRGSDEAVRQAVRLAGCAQRLVFTSIVSAGGTVGDRFAVLEERRGRYALDGATAAAAQRGIAADGDLLHDDGVDIAGALVARAGARDLLVAGVHGNALRTAGATGSVAIALAHRATGPLLVARTGPADARAPHILAAVDDSAAAAAVVEIAAGVAAGCGGYVHLVHVRGADYGSHTRHRLAELSLRIIAATDAEPLVDVLRGVHVAAQLASLAQRTDATLLVTGRRGVNGTRSLGSTSERLVHEAPCSVLLAPVGFA